MITNMAQADKEMAEMFRVPWEVVAGYVCDWPNAKVAFHGEGSTWARWTLDYVSAGQSTFAKVNQRRFVKSGLIFISVMSPLGRGLTSAREASQIALSAYEGKRTPGDVWFRNVRIESEGKDQGTGGNKSWWMTTVVADFTYDYLR